MVSARVPVRWAALLIVAAFVAVICGALLRTVPDDVDRPLTPLPRLAAQRLLPIPVLTSRAGRVTRQLRLLVRDRAELPRIDELRLVLDGYAQSSRLLIAQLDVEGSECGFAAASLTLDFSAVIPLVRRHACDGATGPGRAVLTLQFAAPSPYRARAAIWVSDPDPAQVSLLLIEGEAGATPVGHATEHRSPARVRTIGLLAWMWGVAESRLWAYVAVAAVLLVMAAGFATRSSRTPAQAIGAFCAATGLALLYVVVVPPLQAPDEPDHLLSFGVLTNRADLAASTASWAQRTHFDRIVFRAGERFTPADRDVPYGRPWSEADVFAENIARRSSSATRLWQILSRVTTSDPARVLLDIRTANALLFGLAFGAGTAVLAMGGAAVAPAALAFVLLSIPTLPFFAMQMSEISPNIVAFILLAYAAASMLVTPDNEGTGLLLGLATALIAAGTRSSWPLAAVVGGLLAARVISRRDESGRPWFWVFFAGPVLLLFGCGVLRVPQPLYDQWHLPGLDPRASFQARTIIGATALTAIAGYGFERAWALLRRRTGLGLGAFRLASMGGALGIGATLVASLFLQLPATPELEGLHSIGLWSYIRGVLASVLTTARVGDSDFFVWTSFLSGFGWLDTALPQRLVAALTVLGAGAAIWLLVAVARDKDDRRAAILAFAGLGIVAGVVGCAVGSYGLNRNIHGRYLLGPYLVAIALLSVAPVLSPVRRLSGGVRASALLALMLAIHAVAACVILRRYFG